MLTATTVTGAEYHSTRVRGLSPWKPQAKTRLLLDQVLAVLEEYEDFLPLTLRQVFYRLVGAHAYPKDEHAYERLGEMLNRARRARFVPFDSIRDDGATVVPADGFSGMPEFWANVAAWAADYRIDLLTGQPHAVELWVEAAGMVPQVARVAGDYGVPVYSSGGFDSVTVRHETGRRIASRERPTIMLNVGDHDASGLAIVDSFAADVSEFCRDYGKPGNLTVRRLAVTPEQIERFALPTSPPKANDRRGNWRGGTVQAEALSPLELADEVRTGLESVLDLPMLGAVRLAGIEERAELVATVARVAGGSPTCRICGAVVSDGRCWGCGSPPPGRAS